MTERLLVTSALPYANGSIHLGHLVEYVQTDIYVRFRRACGDHVAYVCAADSHGTPIEVNAAKSGMSPKEFVEKYRREQHEDFKGFGVEFSTFYTTDSPENARWAQRVYRALKAKGLVYKRTVEQLYCERDARFLPDRFVKGTCPRCGTAEQYGDGCERCGAAYDPRELKEPRCAICGAPPVVRASDHAYVDLKKVEPEIRAWVEAEGHLEAAVREQVKGWLADLQDWCITRDAPYFGFPVDDPEYPGKFLYVWVDAPIGYLSSAEHYFADEAPPADRLAPAEFEERYLAQGAPSRLEHFIGKDILRFHAVFWPAMLQATGLKTPDRLAVHGHLTVNGEKMSKSRGTFITGRTYLDSGLDPELLRWFYAANLGPGVSDLDLALEEFRNRVNADLANNIANLASRVHTLLRKESGGTLAPEIDLAIREVTVARLRDARAAFGALEYRDAVRALADLASTCNKELQDRKPWETPGSHGTKLLLYSVSRAIVGLAVGIAPVMPRFATALAKAFGQGSLPAWTPDLDPFSGGTAAPRASPTVAAAEKPPQIARLDAKQVQKLIVGGEAAAPEAKPQFVSRAASPAETATRASAVPAPAGVIQYDDFAKVELRVAVVRAAVVVPKADKLLQLTVDAGDPEPRTIVAGIAQAYPDPQVLVGKRIVVVANLAPRPLRGITSHGMLLAAGEPPNLQVVTVGDGIPPGTRVK